MVQKAGNNENSIAKIEDRLEELRSQPKTKARISEIKRLQTTLNRVYAEYKHKITEFEKTNHEHLALIRSTHGFHKMLGNSLLFYAFNIAPKLNLEAKVFSDGDYEDKSQFGIVSVRDIDEFEKSLKKLKIKRVVTKDKTGNLVIFKLPWEYSDKEIEKFVNQNTYDLHKYNHVIVAENTIPALFLNLNELLKVCYENVRRLEPVAREALGNFIVEIDAEMVRMYVEMTNGRVSENDGLKEIRKRLNQVKSQVKILADLKLWNAKTYARVGEILIKVQEIVDLRLKSQRK